MNAWAKAMEDGDDEQEREVGWMMVLLHKAGLSRKGYGCNGKIRNLLWDMLNLRGLRDWLLVCRFIKSNPLRSSCQDRIKYARELLGEILVKEKEEKGKEILQTTKQVWHLWLRRGGRRFGREESDYSSPKKVFSRPKAVLEPKSLIREVLCATGMALH